MAKKCAVSVCDGPGGSKGCCPKHYQRFLKLKLLEGLETVTPAQADDFDRRWDAAREANPRMAAGAKGGGSGSRIEVRLETTRDPVAPPEPVREVAVPAIKATHKGKAPVPAKAPPKPLPAPVSPDLRAMDDALLEAARRERDKLSESCLKLRGEVDRISQVRDALAQKAGDLSKEILQADKAMREITAERNILKANLESADADIYKAGEALEAMAAERDDLRVKLAERTVEIEKLRAKAITDDEALNNTAARLKAKAEEVDRLQEFLKDVEARHAESRRVDAQAGRVRRCGEVVMGGSRDTAWKGATTGTLDGTRLVAILRASEPLRLAFVDALHDRALQTLRRAAQDPGYADALAADLLALDVPEVG